MKKNVLERKSVQAKLVRKADIPYEDLATGKGIPVTKPIYELIFETEEGELLLAVSEFEFAAVSIGDEGTLVYDVYKRCNELVSFADKIKEFIM